MNYFIRQFGKPTGITGRILGKIMSLSNRKMHKAVMKELRSPEKLLEIGFGSGSQLEMIGRDHPKTALYGIDISGDMFQTAKEKLGTKAELSICSIEKTAFPDDYFDTVITTDTCYFWNDTTKALKEIKRITRSGGRLIIAYNSLYAASVHRSKPDCGMYSDATITKQAEGTGMKVLRKNPAASNRKCLFCQFRRSEEHDDDIEYSTWIGEIQ